MRLVFASNNAHKLAEVREIMPSGVSILSLKDIGFEQEIEETGATLEENSEIKAKAVEEWLRVTGYQVPIDGVFADDTGLEIDALGGKPGVYTARWYSLDEREKTASLKEERQKMTEREIFAANRAKALRELEGKTDRGAQFRTVITLILSENSEFKIHNSDLQVEGVVRGRIAEEEYGEGGFGYDPVFIPEGYDKTFGELPTEVKNRISHRARALAALVEVLRR